MPGRPCEIKAEVEDLNFFYGKLQALKNINMVFQRESGDRHHWPIRLRKVNSCCVASIEFTIFIRKRATKERSFFSQAASTDWPGNRSAGNAHAHEHGFSKTERVSEVGF